MDAAVNPILILILVFIVLQEYISSVGTKAYLYSLLLNQFWQIFFEGGGGHKICTINSCVSNIGGDRLAAMNSVFRTIDLTCLVIAPLVAGLIFDWASTSIAALAVAGIGTR